MKIFVVNFARHRILYNVCCIMLVLCILASVSIGVVNKVYGEKFVSVSSDAILNPIGSKNALIQTGLLKGLRLCWMKRKSCGKRTISWWVNCVKNNTFNQLNAQNPH